MEGLLVIVGLVLLAIPVAVLYLLVSHARLKGQVAEVHRELTVLRRSVEAAASLGPSVAGAQAASPQDLAQASIQPDEAGDATPPVEVPPEAEPIEVGEAKAPLMEGDTSDPLSASEPVEGPSLEETPIEDLPPAARVVAARNAARAAQASSTASGTAPPPTIPPTSPPPSAPPSGSLPFDRFLAWMMENWFYAISALSLALAGLFLVQYGMENGLLPPAARVAAAFAFGGALIGAGEFIRRRYGEAEDSTTAYLPSVFSGAGIVSLFGAVLSARMLYGLIGPEMGLLGMVVVAAIALVLGWFHGPLLAAVGLLGAFGAPVVLGSSNSDASPLFLYFAIVALVGLGVDTLRRWAWVSVLTLVLAYGVGAALVISDGGLVLPFQLYVVALVVMGTVIPARSLLPDHAGALFSTYLRRPDKARLPIFPTFLAAGALGASCVLLVLTSADSEAAFWVSVVALSGLTAAFVIWSLRGQALQDLAALPFAGLLISVVVQADYEAAYWAFHETVNAGPEAAFPLTVSLLVGIAAVLSALAAWRSLSRGAHGVIWAAAAALAAPVMAVLVEVTWRPVEVIGAYPWALHGAALAGLMVFWAERFARIDGPENRLRLSFFVLSALSCISFALVMIFSQAALTAALAVTVVAAAALDRNYNLRPMSLYVAAGVVTIGYRLVADPGLGWAIDAPLFDLLLSHGGAVAGFGAGLYLLRGLKDRLSAQIMLDSAIWSSGGILISLLLFRGLEWISGSDGTESHWGIGLYAAVWFGIALAQAQRLEIGGHRWLRMVRIVLGSVFGGLGAVALLGSLGVVSPLFDANAPVVLGPPLVNSLMVAYLLPAAILILGVWRIASLPAQLALAMKAVAAGLSLYWAFCAIRDFWQGEAGLYLGAGMSQPELYSYTIALLAAGAAVFYHSLARKSAVMRKAGLAVIGLAVAKVFFVDISGLDGLTRVFSLLVLGLSLAGLAWLNRWAQEQSAPSDET